MSPNDRPRKKTKRTSDRKKRIPDLARRKVGEKDIKQVKGGTFSDFNFIHVVDKSSPVL